MNRRHVVACTLLVAATVAAFTRPARAQNATPSEPEPAPAPSSPADVSRSLFQTGIELGSQQRWSEAEDVFRRSYALVPRVSTAYNLALVLLHLRRGRDALDLLAELSRFPTADVAQYRDAIDAMRARALELAARITLTLSPQTAELSLDGIPVPGGGGVRQLIVEPGRHALAVSATGFAPQTLTLDAAAGDRLTPTIYLDALGELRAQPLPPPPAQGQRERAAPKASSARAPADAARGGLDWPAIASFATGGGLLLAGGVLGVLALERDAAFKHECADVQRCPAERRAELEPIAQSAHDFGQAADVLFVAGGIAAAVGLGFVLFGSEAPAEGAAMIAPAGTGATVHGWF